MIIGLFKLNLNTTPHRSVLYDGTKRVPKLVAILKLQFRYLAQPKYTL